MIFGVPDGRWGTSGETKGRSAMHVGPIIAVTDLARARRFYEHALCLDGHETPGGGVVGADVPFDLDADGISVTDDLRVAWMRDPDGNILTVFQLTDAG